MGHPLAVGLPRGSVPSGVAAPHAPPPRARPTGAWLTHGRAAVGLEQNDGNADPAIGPGNNLYFVELNPLLDDVAGGTATVQGPVVTDMVTEVALQGNFAYAATIGGLRVFNIANLMDSDARSTLILSDAGVPSPQAGL